MQPDKLGPPRWVFVILGALAIVTFFGIGIFTIIRVFQGASLAERTTDIVTTLHEEDARRNCIIEADAVRDEIIERRDALAVQSNLDFADYLLGSPRASVETLLRNRTLLEDANEAVLALPKRDDMIDRGYVIDGMRRPPCPKVRAND